MSHRPARSTSARSCRSSRTARPPRLPRRHQRLHAVGRDRHRDRPRRALPPQVDAHRVSSDRALPWSSSARRCSCRLFRRSAAQRVSRMMSRGKRSHRARTHRRRPSAGLAYANLGLTRTSSAVGHRREDRARATSRPSCRRAARSSRRRPSTSAPRPWARSSTSRSPRATCHEGPTAARDRPAQSRDDGAEPRGQPGVGASRSSTRRGADRELAGGAAAGGGHAAAAGGACGGGPDPARHVRTRAERREDARDRPRSSASSQSAHRSSASRRRRPISTAPNTT